MMGVGILTVSKTKSKSTLYTSIKLNSLTFVISKKIKIGSIHACREPT